MKHKFKFTLDMGVYNGKCVHCEQDYRVKSTTQCPEAVLCEDITKRVQSGQLDFVDGSWVSLKPEQESMKQMDDAVSSLIEFMEAMVPELSSEASDELTDEDIDMLKRINRVPLPRRAVRDLVLPVELMVSLHKLNRLDYVVGSPQANQYQVTTKGKEFLKPKPVTLNADHVITLFLLNRRSMSVYEFEMNGYHEEFNWLIENTPFLYPDCRRVKYWELTPVGKEYIQRLLAIPVTPV